jgi:hypothetical protein
VGSEDCEDCEDSVYHPAKEEITTISDGLMERVTAAVEAHQPQKMRVRNGRLWSFAQAVKGIFDGWSRGHLRTIFDMWWKKAEAVVRTKDKTYNWVEFLRAYDNVKHPGGFDWLRTVAEAKKEPLHPAAAYHTEEVQLLVKVCAYLQRQHPRKPIRFLGARQASDILGTKSPRTGYKALMLLVKDKLLAVARLGSHATRKTNEYWYLPLAEVCLDESEVKA